MSTQALPQAVRARRRNTKGALREHPAAVQMRGLQGSSAPTAPTRLRQKRQSREMLPVSGRQAEDAPKPRDRRFSTSRI